MADYKTELKVFQAKYAGEIAKVSKAHNVDIMISSLMIINNARFLSKAMKEVGYKPGLSIDQLVADALAVEALQKPAVKPVVKK